MNKKYTIIKNFHLYASSKGDYNGIKKIIKEHKVLFIDDDMLMNFLNVDEFIYYLKIERIEFFRCKNKNPVEIIDFKFLENVKQISFCNTNFNNFFSKYPYLKSLESLTLSDKMDWVDDNLNIKEDTPFQIIDDNIQHFKSLKNLIIDYKNVAYLSNKISNLKNLEYLHLVNSEIRCFDTLKDLTNLNHLSFVVNNKNFDTTFFFNQIKHLKNLTRFSYSNEYSIILPPIEIFFPKLQHLTFSNLALKNIPLNIRKMKKLSALELCFCEIEEIPEWILELQNLEYLDLSGNNFKIIPIWLNKMPKLHILKCFYSFELENIEKSNFPNIHIEGV